MCSHESSEANIFCETAALESAKHPRKLSQGSSSSQMLIDPTLLLQPSPKPSQHAVGSSEEDK